jgi:hypothetical protein
MLEKTVEALANRIVVLNERNPAVAQIWGLTRVESVER